MLYHIKSAPIVISLRNIDKSWSLIGLDQQVQRL